MSNFKINSFGTPNASTPNTIENSKNTDTYIVNFGGKVDINTKDYYYLFVNGNTQLITDNTQISTDRRFYTGKNCYIKKLL